MDKATKLLTHIAQQQPNAFARSLATFSGDVKAFVPLLDEVNERTLFDIIEQRGHPAVIEALLKKMKHYDITDCMGRDLSTLLYLKNYRRLALQILPLTQVGVDFTGRCLPCYALERKDRETFKLSLQVATQKCLLRTLHWTVNKELWTEAFAVFNFTKQKLHTLDAIDVESVTDIISVAIEKGRDDLALKMFHTFLPFITVLKTDAINTIAYAALHAQRLGVLAVVLNHLETIRKTTFLLMAQKATWDIIEKYLPQANREWINEALIAAVKAQNKNVVLSLLTQTRVDVNFKNYEGERALHLAVQNEDIDIVRLLIKHGANPYLKSYGRTAFDCTTNPYIIQALNECKTSYKIIHTLVRWLHGRRTTRTVQ